MKTTSLFLAAMALAATAGCSGFHHGSSMGAAAGATPSTARASSADIAFVTTAAGGGMYEVEAGRLGSARAAHADVKGYGQMLVDHHTRSNAELMALARAKGITPPATLPPEFQAKVGQLSRLSGPAFDREFIRTAGVQDHTTQIALFEQAARDVTDPDIKAFIAKTLPVLRQHLQSAQSIAGRVAG